MSLKAELAELKGQIKDKLPAERWEEINRNIDALIKTDIEAKAPVAGDTLKDFSLPGHTGDTVSLATLLKDGPAIITFYRGGWCPYCNLELRAYQQELSEIKKLGANLVAISPELPDNSMTTAEKLGLDFYVLSDVESEYGKELGIVYSPSEELRTLFSQLGLDLEQHNGAGNFDLPIPATFVVNTDGVITYAYANADYSTRADIAEVMQALRETSD